jgi:tRNA splicing endonuclease
MDNSEPQFANPQSSSTPAQEQHEESTTPSLPRFDKEHERLQLVRHHYERKGYRVHSGLQFGCEFVLYADDPSKVHSDFCVLVVNEGMDAIHYNNITKLKE